jgi:5-methylcytosine-specific restriction endonuclease McrA
VWASTKPTVTAGESAQACASGIRDKDLRQKVVDACANFLTNSARLQAAAADDKLHQATASDYPVERLSRDNLLWLYDAQLSRKRRPGHEIYDKIMVNAPFGLCVYCHHSVATTLDHFIPKTIIPSLSIDPWNLVPACSDCNHGLLDAFSDQPAEEMLHPYFIPSIGRWLTASIDHAHPVTVRFAATPDASLAPELQARIRYQFDRLRLGPLYSVLCSGELVGVSRTLSSLLGGAAPGEISAYLSESALPWLKTDQNDRRAIMFEALAADQWYRAGGYASQLAVSA